MWLSREGKHLCWEDGDIQKNAKGHTASFHLAFSQENITRTQKKHIGNEQTLTRRHRLTRGWQREMHYKIQNIELKMACVKANLGVVCPINTLLLGRAKIFEMLDIYFLHKHKNTVFAS